MSSLCSPETIIEEQFDANENQPSFLLPTTPALESKERYMPNDSDDAGSEGGEWSGRPLNNPPLQQQTVAILEEEIFLSPNPAVTAAPGRIIREDERIGWKDTEGKGYQPGSQTQDCLALATHWLHPASKCQKGRDAMVGELMQVDRVKKGSAASKQSHHNHVVNSITATQNPLQATQYPMVPNSHLVVRRSKSEGYKLCDCPVSMRHPGDLFPVAEVYSDATFSDHIWSKLDPSKLRDTMSSSSSMSSNDTVIDLSMPSLARKSLPDVDIQPEVLDHTLEKRAACLWSANATIRRDPPVVSKSKSNPNLRANQAAEHELCLRPLSKALLPTRGRPSWSHLYMEGLKRSSLKSKGQGNVERNPLKSKSLEDLTSDDITCTSESRYRSINRSFVTRSMREQRHCRFTRSLAKPPDEFTERLKKLTTFQEENDITSPTSLEPSESEEEEEGLGLLRRSSSRSQSRVKYIANRAKQERQRLKALALAKDSPIEERGNPEGACCFSRGPCMDTANPHPFTSQHENPLDLDCETEVVFMFKL